MAAADCNGAPGSGSAKTSETLACAVFLDADIDLQAEGEAESLGRRPELIEDQGEQAVGHVKHCWSVLDI